MRVISGKAKGRNLLAVPGDSTRPVLDRVKTALFDTLRPISEDCKFLDMFAGTGAIGIEALSQGAEHCVFLDLNAKAIETIKKNVANTNLALQSEIRHADAFTFVRNTSRKFDIIFVAPPQYKGIWIEALHTLAERPEILNKDGIIIVQIDPKEYEELTLSPFKEMRDKKYGNTQILFYTEKDTTIESE